MGEFFLIRVRVGARNIRMICSRATGDRWVCMADLFESAQHWFRDCDVRTLRASPRTIQGELKRAVVRQYDTFGLDSRWAKSGANFMDVIAVDKFLECCGWYGQPRRSFHEALALGIARQVIEPADA